MNCVLAWILAIKIPTLVPGDAGRVPILWAVDNSALPLHSLLTNAPSCHISCCHGWLDNLPPGGNTPLSMFQYSFGKKGGVGEVDKALQIPPSDGLKSLLAIKFAKWSLKRVFTHSLAAVGRV